MTGDELAQYSARYEGVKNKIFNNREELLAYYMVDVNVLRQAWCAFRNLFLKSFKMDPFRQAVTLSSICNKVFRTMFLKPDSECIIPRVGYLVGDPILLSLFNGWCTFVGRVTMLLMPIMGRKFICFGYLMWKLMGNAQRRGKSLRTSGAFGMGVFACTIDTKQLVRPIKL